ncbi:MAG TPA: hypothetical protein VKM94_05850 [Blastocatellia bacterium]|nr:hypothetical protein [Blastocatellia bacterium]
MKLKTVVDVRISPDGSRILYVITEPNLKESNYNSDNTAGGLPRRDVSQAHQWSKAG